MGLLDEITKAVGVETPSGAGQPVLMDWVMA